MLLDETSNNFKFFLRFVELIYPIKTCNSMVGLMKLNVYLEIFNGVVQPRVTPGVT